MGTHDEITTIDALLEYMASNLNITEMSIEKAIDMIAKMIAKSRWKEYRKVDGKVLEHNDHLSYLLNVKPNKNEMATDFWRRAVRKLLRYGECLIIPINNELYIVDSFIKNDVITFETTFSNVMIGSLMMKKTYRSSDVIYMRNRNKKIMTLLKAFDSAYADLISVAIGAYRIGNAPKFSLNLPTQVKLKKDGKVISSNDYVKLLEEDLSSSKLKVILSGAEINLNEITKSTKAFEDVLKIENNIKETVAFMFDIPIDVFIGKTTEKSNAMNDMITFAISPVAEILNDSVNAFAFTEDEYLDGEMIEIDQSSFKHVDVLDVAVQLDKLFADGFSHNDLRDFINMHKLDEDWANKHFVTKNYDEEKGGEENNE